MFPVGIDVSKDPLDLCILYVDVKGRFEQKRSKMTAARRLIFFAGCVYSTAAPVTFI